MRMESSLSEIFPDRTPSWSDLFVLVAVLIFLVSSIPRLLEGGITSLPAIGATFVGVLALTAAGQLVEQRSQRTRRLQRRLQGLRPAGRVVIVAVFVAGIVLIAINLPWSDSTHWGIAVGMMGGIGAYLAVWMFWAGEVSGWWGQWELPTGAGRR